MGKRLPNLIQLKLSGSNIPTIRDLGTSLYSLRVLWLNRSGVTSIAGVSSLTALEELYLAFNHLTDLSPAAGCLTLQTLDAEGNQVESVDDIHILGQCPMLTSLTLEGNPIQRLSCYNKKVIMEAIPSLQLLDDIDLSQSGDHISHQLNGDDGDDETYTAMTNFPSPLTTPIDPQDWPQCERNGSKNIASIIESMKAAIESKRSFETAGVTEEDMRARECRMIQESIKRTSSALNEERAASRAGRPGTARPQTEMSSFLGCRPTTAGGSHTTCQLPPEVADVGSSILTHNTTSIFCGNPTRSLRSRILDSSDDSNCVPTHSSSTIAQSLEIRGDEALLDTIAASRQSEQSDASLFSFFTKSEAISLESVPPVEMVL